MPMRWQFETEAGFVAALRDYFAGQALAGMADWGATDLDAFTCAARAYAFADAMLAERAK